MNKVIILLDVIMITLFFLSHNFKKNKKVSKTLVLIAISLAIVNTILTYRYINWYVKYQ